MNLTHYLTGDTVTVPPTDLNRYLWAAAGYFEPGRSARISAEIGSWSA